MATTNKTYVSLERLAQYNEKIQDLIAKGDTAAAAAALAEAKSYADGLADNYDAAGSAATALTEAKAYTDELRPTIAQAGNAAVNAGTQAANANRLAGQANAAAEAAQADVDALKAYVGTFTHDTAKSVVEYINAKTAGIATDAALEELTNRVTNAEGAIDAIEADYLKKADKEELAGAVALKADKTALDAVSEVANAAVKKADYNVKVKALDDEDARIAGLVASEAEARAEADEDFEVRIAAMEAFFEGAAADEGEGENLKNALDTLKEIQDFATGEGAAAAEMLESIAANTKAIEDMDKAYKAADEALDGRLDVLEAIDHEAYKAADTALKGELEGKINAKADASALTEAVQAQGVKDKAQDDKIAALEAKFDGEGSVGSLIAAAKQEAIDTAAGDATQKANKALEDAKKYADEEDAKIEERVAVLETASAKHALAADLTALTGRVTTAEGEIDTLQSEMDAVEALAAAADSAAKANAAAIALKASQADLEAVSGRVTALETWRDNFTECSEADINALFA